MTPEQEALLRIGAGKGGEAGKAGALPVTNSEFIAAVFQKTPQGASAAVCSKANDPGQGGWIALRVDTQLNRLTKDKNNYICCSSFFPLPNGNLAARKAQFAACHFLMLDGIGTKVPLDRLKDFRLSWLIETSPGNFQGGVVFKDPIEVVHTEV